jgi:carbonic anhydrase-like protein
VPLGLVAASTTPLPECTTNDRRKETHLADDHLLARGTCSALVITCSDFRFKTAERAFLEAAGLADDYDLIARPGAARALVAPRDAASRETMLDEIRLLRELHCLTRVLLVNHVSCRAYDDLATGEAQRAVHESHLRAAAGEVERSLEGVTAEPYLIALVDGELRVGHVE